MLQLILVGGIGVALYLVKRSADRFAATKIRAGEWDENGPKHPTEPPDRVIGRVRVANPLANLTADVDADSDVEELRERDLPGIADLVQQVLDLLLDGSDSSHDALRGQLHSVRIGDIDLASRLMEIRVSVSPSAPRCTPADFQGGVVEIHMAGIPQPPAAGAVVQGGCFSAIVINTFGVRWPRDAEVTAVRLIEPLLPSES